MANKDLEKVTEKALNHHENSKITLRIRVVTVKLKLVLKYFKYLASEVFKKKSRAFSSFSHAKTSFSTLH